MASLEAFPKGGQDPRDEPSLGDIIKNTKMKQERLLHTFRVIEGQKVFLRNKKTGEVEREEGQEWTVVKVIGTPEQPKQVELQRSVMNERGIWDIQQVVLSERETEDLQKVNLAIVEENPESQKSKRVVQRGDLAEEDFKNLGGLLN